MIDRCPVCKSDAVQIVAEYRHKSPIFDKCKRAKCDSCGMSFASPMPPNQGLLDYNAAYIINAHGKSPNSISTTAFFTGIAKLRRNYVMQYLTRRKIPVETVLEFGPGPGFFARSWMEAELSNSYLAIESDVSCHDSLRGLGVELIEQANNCSVDLVVMSHVLEHVPNPINFLQDAAGALRSSGVIFIEVPYLDWEHKAMDEPHVLFFEKETLLGLLKGIGFSDVEVNYFGAPIEKLKKIHWFDNKIAGVRTRLIENGFYTPFARRQVGMENLFNPIERAMIGPSLAHKESAVPSWWVRALARKP